MLRALGPLSSCILESKSKEKRTLQKQRRKKNGKKICFPRHTKERSGGDGIQKEMESPWQRDSVRSTTSLYSPRI